MDICTPLVAFTTLAFCQSQPVCSPPTDGQHSICEQHSIVCPAQPPQFDCVRADQSHYVWEPYAGLQDATPKSGDAP